MTPVRVVYRKYDGALHWTYDTVLLGEDDHGVWLGAVAGTQTWRGSEDMGQIQAPHVLLFPRTRWWTACFNAEPHKNEIYCDITTVPQWPAPGEVTMVDLDLDVIRRRAGQVLLDDADEFAEHQVRFGYPAEVVDSAQASADWLLDAVEQRIEPFGTAYRRWLDRVR